MSPIGPYDNFDDCVSKNQDKSSPEGFCAFLEKKITGKYPSQKHVAPDEFVAAYEAALVAGKTEHEAFKLGEAEAAKVGYEHTRFGWVKQFQSPKLKGISGVKVFAEGTWTDSSGQTRTWTGGDLDNMVKAFKAGVPAKVPLKAGHTPDAFNKRIAEALGVPVEVVTGDQGHGQIALGRMASLTKDGKLLNADFEGVPDAIAGLIEGGQYNTVSVEVEDKIGEFGPVITGVALLGAEEPAVDKASLESALVFGGKREGARVFVFSKATDLSADELKSEFQAISGKVDDHIKGLDNRKAPFFRALFGKLKGLFDKQIAEQGERPPKDWWDRCTLKVGSWKGVNDPEAFCGDVWYHDKPIPKDSFQSDGNADKAQIEFEKGVQMEELKKIAVALGLPDTATIAEIMTAIEALKGKGGTPPAMQAQFAAATAKVATLEAENATLKADKVKGDHDKRYAAHLETAKKFTAVPGKPEDIAMELTDLEEKAGKSVADKAIQAYQKAQDAADAAALTMPKGKSKPGAKAQEFEGEVLKYQKEHPNTTRADAIKSVGKARPDLWATRNQKA